MFRPIPRRTMLRGMGAVLALPLLESMTPRGKAQERLAKPPLRTAFFFMPNGVNVSRWKPAGASLGSCRTAGRATFLWARRTPPTA